MKIRAISDTHGHLPALREPVDVLIVAGDVTPVNMSHDPDIQRGWADTNFRYWLECAPARFIIGVAGNHDFVFEKYQAWAHDLPWYYLQDSGIELGGLNFWGTPWVPRLRRWAFYQNNQGLDEKFGLIPKDTDVLISHGPPYGKLDMVKARDPSGLKRGQLTDERCGSKALLNHIGRVEPALVVCGHIHEEGGKRAWHSRSRIANVSYLDGLYDPWGRDERRDIFEL